MPKVAVLTDFFNIDPAYSLTNVAGNQLKMLKRADYEHVVLLDENFQETDIEPWASTEKRFLPAVPRTNRLQRNTPENWEDHVSKMYEAMVDALQDIDVVLTHDLIYQPAQIIYHVAARKVAAERPDLLWLHWVHSATTPGLLNTKADYLDQVRTKFPHSFVVFPNEYSRPRVARNFGYDEADVKCVPHPIDIPEFFNFHPVTKRLALEKNILGADLVMTLPARLDRGKQVEFPIRIAASAKQMGRSVRFICFDFHSTGDEKVEYREWLEGLARKRGLNEQEVTFMSQFDEETRVSAPRRMIRDMLMVSNAFVLPSRSETYSLVAQEAAACGNILVLNFDFPPMRDIYGSKHPLYAKFSSNIDAMTGMDGDTVVEYNPSVDTYCNDIAGRVLYEIENNRGIAMRTRTRKTRNLRYIFKNYLEPLLYAKKKGMKDDHE